MDMTNELMQVELFLVSVGWHWLFWGFTFMFDICCRLCFVWASSYLWSVLRRTTVKITLTQLP